MARATVRTRSWAAAGSSARAVGSAIGFEEGEAVGGSGRPGLVDHGVGQAAGGADDGDGAVAHGDELGEPAGLVKAGDQQHVGRGVDAVGELESKPR